MIYITGDLHIPIDIGKLTTKNFPEQKNLSKSDFLIICGDFGGVWNGSNEDLYWQKWFDKKNFTTLFVDGNHENFDLLKTYPEVSFHGATAHKINDSLFHIKRGQILELESKTFFVFGGASSHDKAHRTEGKNWWREELPTEDEIESAKRALDKHNKKVDYIVTHCTATSVQNMVNSSYERNILTDFFEEVNTAVTFEKWFFGHYHKDKIIDEKHIALFNKLYAI